MFLIQMEDRQYSYCVNVLLPLFSLLKYVDYLYSYNTNEINTLVMKAVSMEKKYKNEISYVYCFICHLHFFNACGISLLNKHKKVRKKAPFWNSEDLFSPLSLPLTNTPSSCLTTTLKIFLCCHQINHVHVNKSVMIYNTSKEIQLLVSFQKS